MPTRQALLTLWPGRLLLAGLVLSGQTLAPARADDLRGALLAAYGSNPTLAAAREQQKATDEGVPIARAEGLPSANATATETEYVVPNPANFVSPQRLAAFSGTLNVPLYSGGAVKNAVKAAETRVGAGKYSLAGSEAQVFSQVVAAYMDVILDAEIVRFNHANVQMLDVNLQATQERFQIGDLTRTDVAQSQSRLAVAQGDLRTAEANLIGAREHYIEVVGKPPQDLAPPPSLPGLPASVDDAVLVALDSNPDLAAARLQTKAAHYDVGAARASRLPRIGLFADGEHDDYLGSLPAISYFGQLPDTANSADVGVRATLPLFQGGKPSAQIRQAEANEGAALDQEVGTERSIVAQVRSAFSSWQAANAIIGSTQTALDAARLSLAGVKAENSVGNRTVLDILNAEQEMVNAEVQLVTAQRNAYVAGFTLLAAMGKARAADLGLDGGPLYDPDVHYRHVRADVWDWGGDSEPTGREAFTGATRTVDTKAQDSAIPTQ